MQDSNRTFVSGLGRVINFRACLWVLQGPRHIAKCWLSTQHLILFLLFRLESQMGCSGQINVLVEPLLASLQAISFPRSPACPGTHYSPTVCRVEISFKAFWHCFTNGDAVLAAWSAQSRLALRANTNISLMIYPEFQFHKRRLISHIPQPERLDHVFLEDWWTFFVRVAHRPQHRSPPPSWTHL